MNLNRKVICRAACCLLALLAVLAVFPVTASAEEAYPSYTYNGNGQPVPTATPYEPVTVLNTDALGIGPMDGPTDLYVTDAGEIFVLDAGNDRVVVLDKALQAAELLRSCFELSEEPVERPAFIKDIIR